MEKPNFNVEKVHISKENINVKYDAVGTCPECGSNLVMRYGKYGKFIACNNYPTCKYIKDKNTSKNTTDKECPKCNSKLEILVTRTGKGYYRCLNFPKCDYTLWLEDDNEIENITTQEQSNDKIEQTIKRNQKLEKYSEQFKQGYREDLQMEFRSSWEANIARILNYLKIEYDFEKDLYKTVSNDPKYKFASHMYIPDFVLKNGTILEVKGNYDLRSLGNTELFKKLYPNECLKIIDSDIYYLLTKKYSKVIENWEEKTNIKSFTIPIVGITLKERKTFVDKLNIGDELLIEREPNNNYDKNAIKVLDKNNNHIGYFPSDYAIIYAPKIDMGITYTIKLKNKEDKKLDVFIKANNLDEIDTSNILDIF